jgi:hypothetical protein
MVRGENPRRGLIAKGETPRRECISSIIAAGKSRVTKCRRIIQMTRKAFLVTDSLASYDTDTRTFLLTSFLLERKMTCEVGLAPFRILTIHSPGSVVS